LEAAALLALKNFCAFDYGSWELWHYGLRAMELLLRDFEALFD